MIVIPMVGRSSRFFQAGYTRPKYELALDGGNVFAAAVGSFEAYFRTDYFLFLVRSDYEAERFVREHARALGIERFSIVVFHHETAGQADTVYQGLQQVEHQGPLYIFNIDTFRPGFSKPKIDCDGFLEVFSGEGEHWSFVLPGLGGKALRTTEKERISDLCSDGLYYFRSRELFEQVFERARAEKATVRSEFYIAPLYNYLIGGGKDVRYVQVDRSEVVFCGTPAEYRQLLDTQ